MHAMSSAAIEHELAYRRHELERIAARTAPYQERSVPDTPVRHTRWLRVLAAWCHLPSTRPITL